MKARFAILAALALAAPPAWGQSWQDYKSYFLEKGRANLMTACAQGRRGNSSGISFWDYSLRKYVEDGMSAAGMSPSRIEAFSAGKAAAMAEVCPDVR